MARREDIVQKLKSAAGARELYTETILQLEEDIPDMTMEMLEEYLQNIDWLENNGQKVLESTDPGMAKLKKELANELAYARGLNALYNDKLSTGKIDFATFITDLRMMNAALRDGTLDAAPNRNKPSSNVRPSPALEPAKPTPKPQQGGGPTATPQPEEDDLADIMKQIAEAEAKEARDKEQRAKDKNRGGPGGKPATLTPENDDDLSLIMRQIAENDARERQVQERREQNRDGPGRSGARKNSNVSGRGRDGSRPAERDRKLIEYSQSDGYEDVVDSFTKKGNRIPVGGTAMQPSPSRYGQSDVDRRREVEKNRDAFGRVIGTGMDGIAAERNAANIIGRGKDGMLAERDAANIIGRGKDGMLAERQAADIIGRGKDGVIAERQAADIIGRGAPTLINAQNIGSLIGGSTNTMLNQKGFADLVGTALPSMINQDNFGKLLGSALNGGLSSIETEQRVANEQQLEFAGEIRKKESALEELKAIIEQDQLKEVQLKDKLHSLRSLAADIKGETEIVRKEAEQKIAEKEFLQKEVKALKEDLKEIEKEVDQIKRGDTERINVHQELRKERINHREQLQKLENEIQTYKSGYQSLMKQWEEEINGVADKNTDSSMNIRANNAMSNNYLGGGDFDRYSVSTAAAYPIAQREVSISRLVPTTTMNAAPVTRIYSNQASQLGNLLPAYNSYSIAAPTYQPQNPVATYNLGSVQYGGSSQMDSFSGSKYASRYLSKNFKK